MADIQGRVDLKVNGDEAAAELKRLQNKASELRQEILKVQKEQLLKKSSIDEANKALKLAQTRASDLRIEIVKLSQADVIDEKALKLANAELAKADAEIKSINKELRTLEKNPALNALNAELKATNNQLRAIDNATFEYSKVLKNLSGATIKDLNRAHAQLSKEIQTINRNTDEYRQKSKQLAQISTTIGQVRNEMRGVAKETLTFKDRLGKMADNFNRFGAMSIGIIGSLTGLVVSARKAVDAFNEFESSQDNLQALTGLSEEKVKGLGDAAIEMSTSVQEGGVRITKSAKDIVDAFTSAGSKRPELLANAEALKTVTNDALILAEAAKMELDPAIGAVTAAMNQFGLGADESRRIINVFAAGSKAGSAEVDSLGESFKNVGTVASESNMTLEETVAALEVLGEKQIYSEEAGTKLRGALLKLKQTGVGYASGTFNMRDALVEANAQLEKQGTEAQKDALKMKLFGAENITVGSILLGNIQKYDELTIAVTGTNTAIEQAAINTDNNAAKLEQAKNRAQENAIVLGEQLAPALTFSTNAFSYLLKVLVTIIKNWDTFAKYLKIAVAGIVAYTVVTKGATIATFLQEKATLVLKKANDLLSISMKKTPWGLIIAGVAAAITAFILFREKAKEAEKPLLNLAKAGDIYSEKMAEVVGESDALFGMLKTTEKGTLSYDNVLKAVNEKYKTYLPNLLTQQTSLEDIEKAQKAVNEALLQNIAIESQKEEFININKEYLRSQREIFKIFNETIKPSVIDRLDTFNFAWFQAAANAGLTADQISASVQSATGYSIIDDNLRNLVSDTKRAALEFENGKKSIGEFYSTLITGSEEAANSGNGTGGGTANAQAKADDSRMLFELTQQLHINAIEDERKRAAAELEIWFTKEQEKILMAKASEEQKNYALSQLDAAYTAKRIDNEKAYQDELLKRYQDIEAFVTDAQRGIVTEQERLNEIELAAIDGKYQKQIDAATKFASEDVARREEYLRIISDLETVRDAEKKAYLEEKEREHAEKIQSIREQYGLVTDADKYQQQLDQLKAYKDQELLTEAEYEQALFILRTEHQKQLDAQAQAAHDKEMQNRSENLAQISAVISASESLTNAAKERELQRVGDDEEKKKQIQKKYADIEFAITLAQIAATAAKAYMEAAALALTNPFAGGLAYVALTAQAGASTLAATNQRNAVMQLADGKYDVVGEDDGKHYAAPLVPTLSTGIVRKPTLVAEEPEFVVDNRTLYNAKTDRYGMTVMDHARAISSMRSLRVPQRARGKYQTAGTNVPATMQADNSEMIAELRAMRSELGNMRSDLQNFKGKLKAQIVYTDLEDYEAKINKVRNDTSVL